MKIRKIKIDGKEVEVKERGAHVSVKALDDSQGIVEAYVSIFGNVDSAGDIVEKGAFGESLARKFPKVVWAHNWEEIIGKVLEAREDDKGLYVKFQLVLDVQRGKEAYALLKSGAVDEFSIGYSIDDYDVDGDGIWHLRKLRLYEISPVLAGANPATELLSVKSAEKTEEEATVEEPNEEDQDAVPDTEIVEEPEKTEPEQEPEKPAEEKSEESALALTKDALVGAADAIGAAMESLDSLKKVLASLSEEKQETPSDAETEEGSKQVDAQARRFAIREVQKMSKAANQTLYRLKRLK